MAPSLQELIDFLLNEVALCGNQGATVSEVLKASEAFYEERASQDTSQRRQNVDRRFKAKLWSWLTHHPEISVGKENQWQDLTLDDVERLESQGQQTLESPEAEETAHDEEPASAPSIATQVRIFVSAERTWHAIAGHAPDDTKVPASEFALLSIIASRKSAGIDQVQLVKASGQDKRSIPKRTDALLRKGYIEKRAIQIKSARTSLCTHRRFVNAPPDSQIATQERTHIDLGLFTTRLFDILKEHKIISRDDLKKHLGFQDRWRWKILSRALRKFEMIGVLKRVKAESQYQKLHPCVMLLREPTAKDIERFHESDGGDVNADADDRAELDEDLELDTIEQNPEADDGDVDTKAEKHVVSSGRIVPSWNPDRPLPNQIFDAVNKAGFHGLTNQAVNRICFGSFYRRPSESMLHRLTDCWQISQPLHLRHLTIVRDTAIEKTIIFYQNFSFESFRKRVEAGEASWESVEFPNKGKRNNEIPAIDATVELDQYGLPIYGPPKGLLNNGRASLFEGIVHGKPPDYCYSSSDPSVIQLPNGEFVLNAGHVKFQPGMKRKPAGQATPLRMFGRPKGLLNSKPSVAGEGSPDPGTQDSPDSFRQPRGTKNKKDKFRGLSRKERFEALGLDETWTEYKALVMDKPSPGVYITPQGKRRPAGKKQGRPRISRIAVFKSDKLRDFPWFVQEWSGSDEEDEAAAEETATVITLNAEEVPLNAEEGSLNNEERPFNAEMAGDMPRVSLKRARSASSLAETPTPASMISPKRKRGRPRKEDQLKEKGKARKQTKGKPKQKTSRTSGATNVPSKTPTAPVLIENSTQEDAATTTTTKHSLSAEDTQEASSNKRQRTASPERATVTNGTQLSMPVNPDVPVKQKPTPASKTKTPMAKETPVGGATKEKSQKAAADRGGSVNFLRRKIILGIVEKAGGAYPAGNEIWYPFVSEWMNLKYKGKPDMRTIKASIGYLVETGKLRQHTFSGKDLAGVMITKTIIAMPEIAPDDPVIKDMQDKMLATDRNNPRVSFSPNVTVHPDFSKPSNSAVGKRKFELPVVSGTQVHLQSVPAFVRTAERLRKQRVERALYKRLMKKNHDWDSENDEPLGPGRLKRLRGPRGDPGSTNIVRSKRTDGWLRRLLSTGLGQRIFSFGPYAMLMNPHQTFHPNTGTFSTQPASGLDPNRLMKKTPARTPFVTKIIGPRAMLMNAQQIFHPSTGTFATYCGRNLTPVMRKSAIRFPSSIGDISKLATTSSDDYDFFKTVDQIARWELNNEEMFDNTPADGHYISHAVSDNFQSAPTGGLIRFDVDEPAPEPRRGRRRLVSQRGQPTKGQPRRERRLQMVDAFMAASQNTQPIRQAAPSAPRHGRRRNLQPIPESLHRKIMLAIVAVRVLAGGSESRHVDWDLVAACFPGHDAQTMIDRGRNVLSKARLQILKMQHDFQEKFLEAYAKDEVPPIDYANLEKYPWPTLIEWANFQLDVSTSERAPSLPATREQFDEIFVMREEPIPTADEIFITTSGITVNQKRAIMSRVPFAATIDSGTEITPSRRQDELRWNELVKSFVRANIVTPEDSHDPIKAKTTLQRFGEHCVEYAVQTLIRDRVIITSNHGRVTPGRNYDITEYMLQQLNRKRLIEIGILRNAANYKSSVVDPKLQQEAFLDVEYIAPDAHILAIVNLFANGRVDLVPRGTPRNKFGLTDDGYLTRQIDKAKLHFAVEVRPRESYVYGNPIQEIAANTRRPPLSAPVIGEMRMIPLWMDLNGHLVRPLWEMAVSSILGCLALREGISAKGIGSMIKPSMAPWEIELLLGWLAEIGVARKWQCGKETRWKVLEWWWLTVH